MTDPIPEEAVEAAARALVAWQGIDPDDTCDGEHRPAWMEWTEEAQVMVTAAAPHIAKQATAKLRSDLESERQVSADYHEEILAAHAELADLRAGIEALRDEWRARAASLRAVDSYAATLCDEHADALDALLRGAANV